MGRIPKLIKEKALAEHLPPSLENEDPAQSSPSRVPSTNPNSTNPIATTSTFDINLPSIDDNLFFADLDRIPIDSQLKCHTPTYIAATPNTTSAILSSNHRYELPDNFTIDETKQREDNEHDPRIVTLDRTALINYMTNCEEHFANNVIERMKSIVEKISHPTDCTELDYDESSFIRYLRWKMFDLSNTYNGRTRQLIERMNSMIQLGV